MISFTETDLDVVKLDAFANASLGDYMECLMDILSNAENSINNRIGAALEIRRQFSSSCLMFFDVQKEK